MVSPKQAGQTVGAAPVIGLRSVKEIKEKMKQAKKNMKAWPKAAAVIDMELSIYEWLLRGEPRFSVAELEKIEAYIEEKEIPDYGVSLAAISELIEKNPKKVQEILK